MKHRWAVEVRAKQSKKAAEQDSGIAAIPEQASEPIIELPPLPQVQVVKDDKEIEKLKDQVAQLQKQL
jgi:hypothetical protein